MMTNNKKIISTIPILVLFLISIPTSTSIANATVGSSEWLDGVKRCVDIYQNSNHNETQYYDCMLDLDAATNSNDDKSAVPNQ